MENKISIFYNLENDDLFGVIASDTDFCAYSKMWQHSNIALSYIDDSVNASIDEQSFELYNELKQIYTDAEFIEQHEMKQYLNL